MKNQDLYHRAVSAAYLAVKERGYFSAVDVFIGMGLLTKKDYESWRFGQVPYLEKVIQCNLSKITTIMKSVRKWATEQNLKASETGYVQWGKCSPKCHLRFSKSGTPSIEQHYRTHYVKNYQNILKEQASCLADTKNNN